jgi:hypothetical protein
MSSLLGVVSPYLGPGVHNTNLCVIQHHPRASVVYCRPDIPGYTKVSPWEGTALPPNRLLGLYESSLEPGEVLEGIPFCTKNVECYMTYNNGLLTRHSPTIAGPLKCDSLGEESSE